MKEKATNIKDTPAIKEMLDAPEDEPKRKRLTKKETKEAGDKTLRMWKKHYSPDINTNDMETYEEDDFIYVPTDTWQCDGCYFYTLEHECAVESVDYKGKFSCYGGVYHKKNES
jgi:hypothetical protein